MLELQRMSSESVLLSVIIPTYNRLEFLKCTLASLPERKEVEVIQVDERSTDGTVAYLESLENVSHIRQGNSGPTQARITGAGKYS